VLWRSAATAVTSYTPRMVGGEFHHQALKEQVAAFRAATVQAGPDAAVPTCPQWDVRELVRHLARVYAMVNLALSKEPDDARPAPPRAPEDFDAALTWWDEQSARLTTTLSTSDPDRPVWSFFPGGTPRTWTRRVAHETAIHRLDAEHALAGLGPDHVHDLIFDPAFAADGVDEMLSVLLPAFPDWSEQRRDGRVLYHAADAGRLWLVTHRPQEPPVVGSPTDAALGTPEVDATVAGTADALYRRVWGRPSTAVVTGDHELAGLVAGR
jgi:uncharacterized protein (TIGR03083 family)